MNETGKILTSIIAIVILTTLNVFRAKFGEIFSNIFTGLKLIGILIIIGVGFIFGNGDLFCSQMEKRSERRKVVCAYQRGDIEVPNRRIEERFQPIRQAYVDFLSRHPGHAAGHVVYYLPDEKVLVGGVRAGAGVNTITPPLAGIVGMPFSSFILLDLAAAVVEATSQPSDFRFLYPVEWSLKDKINAIATKFYGAGSVEYSDEAEANIKLYTNLGFGSLPVCMAKTPLSLSHDPKFDEPAIVELVDTALYQGGQ